MTRADLEQWQARIAEIKIEVAKPLDPDTDWTIEGPAKQRLCLQRMDLEDEIAPYLNGTRMLSDAE